MPKKEAWLLFFCIALHAKPTEGKLADQAAEQASRAADAAIEEANKTLKFEED